MKEITLALDIAEKAMARNRWVRLSVSDKDVITLEIGPFKFNGERETKSATYKFYTDADGVPHYVTYAHP
jgi:hypothetical protein